MRLDVNGGLGREEVPPSQRFHLVTGKGNVRAGDAHKMRGGVGDSWQLGLGRKYTTQTKTYYWNTGILALKSYLLG